MQPVGSLDGVDMADENNPAPEGAQPAPAQGETPPTGDNPHLREAIDKRDAFKAQLQEAQAKLAQYEQAEAEKAAAQAAENGKLREYYEGELAKEKARNDALEAQGLERDRRDRTNKFVQAIAREAGIENTAALELLLPGIKDLDSAPEIVGKPEIAAAIKGLRSLAPQLFPQGDAPPPPTGGKVDPSSKEYWVNVGKQMSADTVSPEYAAATGRE